MRAAARTAPQARSAFGAPLRSGPPLVTFTLIGLCVVLFVGQMALGSSLTNRFLFSPIVGDIEPWRFLTAAFLHKSGSLMHIGFNMYALWVLGQFLEPALGRVRFAALYLLSAVGGSVAVLLLASPLEVSWVTGVVGASGAVFGLFGAVIVALRRLGRSARQILVVLAINAALPFLLPGIAWQAHAGGLVTGVALGFAYAYAPRARRDVVGLAATVAVAVVLVLLSLLKYASV
ncbi:MAG: rhomboid family intramembrane serine protease [Cellulomonadaceae bacterium]|nr:rhomboid family intramembrane serine protease [Cellulomonadaceae bacterium]